MPKEKKSFCVVCIANYCRSPVLEALLKKDLKIMSFIPLESLQFMRQPWILDH